MNRDRRKVRIALAKIRFSTYKRKMQRDGKPIEYGYSDFIPPPKKVSKVKQKPRPKLTKREREEKNKERMLKHLARSRILLPPRAAEIENVYPKILQMVINGNTPREIYRRLEEMVHMDFPDGTWLCPIKGKMCSKQFHWHCATCNRGLFDMNHCMRCNPDKW